jgi:prepilin-type N-terminal cleavage/methylation domain-containing protein
MKHGFSLVELSIVLVILGLLTGGILAGQSLIRASELRAVTTEFQRYAAAGNTFRDKYFALAGDFRDATKFWNLATATACVSNSGVAAGSPGACDGNGDGMLSNSAAGSESGERSQFWRHLALAGLIEGSYTGIIGPNAFNHHIIGTNCPASKLSNGGWNAFYWVNAPGGSATVYAMDFGNGLWVGAPITNAVTNGPIMKPEEAWNIDTKLDDGKPAYGKVIGIGWNNACASADDGTTADTDHAASYRLSDSTNQCALMFRKLW